MQPPAFALQQRDEDQSPLHASGWEEGADLGSIFLEEVKIYQVCLECVGRGPPAASGPIPSCMNIHSQEPRAGPGSAQIPLYGAGGEGGRGLQPRLQGLGLQMPELKGGLGLEHLLLFQQLQPERNMQAFP